MIQITLPKQKAIDFLKQEGYNNEAELIAAQENIEYAKISIITIKHRAKTYDDLDNHLALEKIKTAVCEILRIEKEKFNVKCREREVVDAKKIYSYMGWKYTSAILKQIGHFINNADHTTVMFNRDEAAEMIDVSFKSKLNKVEDYIMQHFNVIREIN